MTSKDTDLLARLNALKPTSVQLNSTPQPSFDVETSNPRLNPSESSASVEDRLASRLKSLRAGTSSPAANVTARPTKDANNDENAADVLTSQIKDEVATSEPLADWQQGAGTEQSIDDLLAELELNEQAKLDPEDPKDVAALLKEARDALPSEHEAGDGGEGGGAADEVRGEQHGKDGNLADEPENAKSEDQQDEEEADNYVQRVLAELDVERKYGLAESEPADQHEDKDEERSSSPQHQQEEETTKTTKPSATLDLPSTPSAQPIPPSTHPQPPDLSTRLSALSLPSTPSTPPSAQAAQKAASALAKTKPNPKTKINAPNFTDEEIDSWCCICNEDGELKCLGCEGDVYCRECWNEGHGEGEGRERGHRAVVFVRKGGGGGTVAA